jgi:hypothetical protein
MTMTPETKSLRFTLDELVLADDEMTGFCLACRAPRDCCEPDAADYRCDDCGEHAVYGPHWIAIAGLFAQDAP